MRPTVHDVAREAGVSLATVDRVINKRPGVRAMTIARVEDAIRMLGYEKDLSAANMARGRTYRFRFILPNTDNSFMHELAGAVEREAFGFGDNRVEADLVLVEAFDDKAIVAALGRIDPGHIHGVALVAPDTPLVTRSIAALVASGVKVATLVSSVSGTSGTRYVGIDNRAAGRTAGELIGRFLPQGGKVGIVAGSLGLQDHVQRRSGFEEVAAAHFPLITPVFLGEGFDDHAITRKVVASGLSAHPDIKAIYNAGAGVRGLLDAVAASGPAERLRIVAHELTSVTRAAMRDGIIDAVLNQDPGHEVRSAVRTLKAMIDGSRINPELERIRIEIFTRSNIVETISNGG